LSIFCLDETAKKATPLAKDAGFNGTLGWSALSPDGQRIAVGHMLSGALHVFDTTTGQSIAQHESAHASPISAMAFSSDGGKLATADSEGTIKSWQDAQKAHFEEQGARDAQGPSRGDHSRRFFGAAKRDRSNSSARKRAGIREARHLSG
jgi:hypothetical protein